MKICSVRLSNFKTFDEEGIRLSLSELTAIVGQNSSGKTSILEALEFFFSGKSLTKDWVYQYDLDRKIEICVGFSGIDGCTSNINVLRYTNNDEMRVKLIFVWNEEKGKFDSQYFSVGWWKYTGDEEMQNPYPDKRKTQVQIASYIKKQPVCGYQFSGGTPLPETISQAEFYADLREYWGKNFDSMPKEWVQNESELDSKLLDFPQYIYIPVNYSIDDEAKNIKGSRFQFIFQFLTGNLFFDAENEHMQAIKQHAKALYMQQGLDERRNELNETLKKLSNQFIELNMQVEYAELDIESAIQPKTKLSANDGFDTDIAQKGHGMQRVAIFQLLQAYVTLHGKEAGSKDFIFAIEEPEIFMHPSYKRSLYSMFKKLASSNFQVIYSTHDPAFITMERFDDIKIVRKQKRALGCRSVLSELSWENLKELPSFQAELKKYNTPQSLREALANHCCGAQNEGFFSEKVILVEGPTESYALPVYFDLLGFDLDSKSISIVEAGSVNNVSMLFAIFDSFGIPCYCIFDGDKPENDLLHKRQRIFRKKRKEIKGSSGCLVRATKPLTTFHKHAFALNTPYGKQTLRGV